MQVTLTIEDTDLGMNALGQRLMALGKSNTEAGLFTAKEAQKGVWLEFGHGEVDGRPWLSVAADTGAGSFGTAMGVAIGNVCDGQSPRVALEPVGELMADTAANVISSRNVGGDPLADSTVERKGHGIKGLDSGKMIGAIKWKVRSK